MDERTLEELLNESSGSDGEGKSVAAFDESDVRLFLSPLIPLFDKRDNCF